MKKKIIAIILIVILLVVFIINKFKKNPQSQESKTTSYESKVIKQDIINTLSSSGYVETALEENKSLHATYYFEKRYFTKNQTVKKGTKLIKYTNGKYLKAPYDCVITDYSLPSSGKVCTNRHYLTMQSVDSLKISMTVKESNLSSVSVGQEARVTIDSLDNKEYVGYVTSIGNSGTYSSSESTFPVVVEFENDGDVLLGMSVKSSIVLEKTENAITVAKDAIEEENGSKYVTVKNESGTEKVTIETGISNDAYTEVKSGLSEGDIVIITEEENSSSNGFNKMRSNRGNFSPGSSSGNGSGSSNRPTPPSGDFKMPNK